MANFKGFNTINQFKKFTLTDVELIKRDLLNAFLISEGQLVGRPEVGTNIWSYIFDPNDVYTEQKIDQEIRRVIEMDSRIELHELEVTFAQNIVRAHIEISLLPGSDVEAFYINFLENSNTATIT